MTDVGNALRVRATLAHAWRNFRSNLAMVMLGLAAMVVCAIVQFWPLQVAILSLAQFELTFQSLGDDDLLPAGAKRRLLPAVGLQLIVAALAGVGLMVFVIPGLYLYMRLFLAVPALIAEEATVLDAIASSWRRTAGRGWPLIGMFLLAITPMAAIWAAMFSALTWELGVWPVAVPALLALIVTPVTIIFGWFVAAAAYAEGGADSAQLREVFA